MAGHLALTPMLWSLYLTVWVEIRIPVAFWESLHNIEWVEIRIPFAFWESFRNVEAFWKR